MNSKELGCEDVDWICRAQDREPWRAFVRTAMNLLALLHAGNLLSDWATPSFSRRTQHRVVGNKRKGRQWLTPNDWDVEVFV
jgi:hypothetical protein